jgi:nucleotide-binding universal stress UspA family protein
MKTIIVPTDFSLPASNALLYAGQLAESIGASVFILHVYQLPISMNEVPALLISAEELREKAEFNLDKSRQMLLKVHPSLDIRMESRLGDVVDELNGLSEQLNPFAIVIGRRGASVMERVLFGSTSLAIIRKSRFPVIAVPHSAEGSGFHNIALAVDDLKEEVPAQKIKSTLDQLQAKLHIIHVQENRTGSFEADKLASELNSSFTIIRDEEFLQGIQNYVQKNNIDLLIILPHRHSLLERMFTKTHTAELIQELALPILCL